jgi:PPOX class probable F420-dependent enzyme
MAEFNAREMFASSQVAQLATVNADGIPHLVPIVFAVSHDVIYTAVDAKRKSSQRLRRMANIEANPAVSLIVDHYDEDWSQLWWVRADGLAQIHYRGEEMATGYFELRRKYVQYQRIALDGPVIAVTVHRWSGWQA